MKEQTPRRKSNAIVELKEGKDLSGNTVRSSRTAQWQTRCLSLAFEVLCQSTSKQIMPFPSFPSADGNHQATLVYAKQCGPSNASLEQKLLVVRDDEFHPITRKSVTRSMQRVMAVKTVVRQTCFGKYLRQQHDASQTTKRCSENKTFSRTLSCRIRVDDCRFYVRHLFVCLHPALS